MTSKAGSTRDRILAALAEIVLEGGLSDFSVQGVADRCGITHRTVYRHFPTRESMLDGLVQQMSDAMAAAGGAAQVATVDELPHAVSRNFAMFTDHEALAKAAVRFSVGTATENRDRRQRTDAVSAAVAKLGLSDGDARLVTGVLRHLSSSRTWLLLREAGLDAADTTAAAGWAIEALVASIRDGLVPSTTTASEPIEPTPSKQKK
ncbi:MAG: TetR/AcrR family transcriptional regulator [Acidimicrobiia bacterium]|nr:TetR/AcrR family transcriptional regulator [Acidimicrobiia bacterium]MDH5520471.1 TetR/AcrR family transcriptional regulator [Acidimicrobiia bacterium]